MPNKLSPINATSVFCEACKDVAYLAEWLPSQDDYRLTCGHYYYEAELCQVCGEVIAGANPFSRFCDEHLENEAGF